MGWSSFWSSRLLKLEALLLAGFAVDFFIAVVAAVAFSSASPRISRPFRGFFLVLRHRTMQHTISAALRTIPALGDLFLLMGLLLTTCSLLAVAALDSESDVLDNDMDTFGNGTPFANFAKVRA